MCFCGVSGGLSYLEGLGLEAQALGAELHDRVGAEGVPDLVLADRQQPQSRVHLQL